MSYPERRRVVLTWADTQSLTVLEQARACVLAGVRPADMQRLMRGYLAGTAEPEEILAGAMLFYAIAYELEHRLDPALSWDDAQGWDVKLDPSTRDPIAAAEAEARVRTSLATGVPLAQAGELTMDEVAAYSAVSREARGGRRHVARRRR